MKRLTIKIGNRDEMIEKLKKAVETRTYMGSYVVFSDYETFSGTLTRNRLRMLETLINQSEGLTVRALAEILGRNVRAVHDDLKTLEIHGLVVVERGNIHVPYDDLHIDVHIRRRAA